MRHVVVASPPFHFDTLIFAAVPI